MKVLNSGSVISSSVDQRLMVWEMVSGEQVRSSVTCVAPVSFSFSGREVEQASEEAGKKRAWVEQKSGRSGEGVNEKGEGYLSSPPLPAPYVVFSLSVLFVWRGSLETPTTQARNNRELKLQLRGGPPDSCTSSVFLGEKEENTRIVWRLSLRIALIPKSRILLTYFTVPCLVI